jgi:hypothetical protein
MSDNLLFSSGGDAPAWEPSLGTPASRVNKPLHLRRDGIPTPARGNDKTTSCPWHIIIWELPYKIFLGEIGCIN